MPTSTPLDRVTKLLGHLVVLVGIAMIAAVAAIMTIDRRDLGV
jgi:hypothetical protein